MRPRWPSCDRRCSRVAAFSSRSSGAGRRSRSSDGSPTRSLVLGGVKLVVEDVAAGRPLTLFVAFGLYGAVADLDSHNSEARSCAAAPGR